MVRFSTPLSFSFLVSSCIRAIITSLSSLTVKAYWKWTTNKQQIIHRNMQDDHIKMTGSLRPILLYYIGYIRKLKRQRRRRLRKRHLKSEVALLQTLSRLFYLIQILAFVFWSWVLKAVSQFRKRRRKSLPCVHVLPENVKLGISAP